MYNNDTNARILQKQKVIYFIIFVLTVNCKVCSPLRTLT